jgi:hypothetical protein
MKREHELAEKKRQEDRRTTLQPTAPLKPATPSFLSAFAPAKKAPERVVVDEEKRLEEETKQRTTRFEEEHARARERLTVAGREYEKATADMKKLRLEWEADQRASNEEIEKRRDRAWRMSNPRLAYEALEVFRKKLAEREARIERELRIEAENVAKLLRKINDEAEKEKSGQTQYDEWLCKKTQDLTYIQSKRLKGVESVWDLSDDD